MNALVPAGHTIRQEVRCSLQTLEEKTSLQQFVGAIGPDNPDNCGDRYLLLLGMEAEELRPLRHGGWAWKLTYIFQPFWLVDSDINPIDSRRVEVSS